MSWPLVNLGELVDPAKGSLVSGPFGSNIGSRFFVDEGVPIIRGNNLTKGAERFLDEGFAFLTEQKASEFANCKALPGDIVLTAAGSIGQVGIIPENRKYDYYIISNKQIRARIDLRKAIPDFVYLWLSSSQMVRYIESQNNGGAVPLLNLSLVRRLPVPCPPLDEQARIAAMLSAYDDLIENNRRRIGLLEEAARLLYREWFVHFRFPGHEHVKIINGLPEGWELLALETVCNKGDGIQTGPFGSQLHQSDYSDTGIPVVMPKDLISFRINVDGIARIPEDTAEKLSRHRMVEGDIVYGRRGDIGRRGFINAAQSGWLCGTGCLRIRPDESKISPRFLFDTLGSPETAGTIANRAKGATMLNLNTSLLKSVPVLAPKRSIQELFVDNVRPIADLIEILSEENAKLASARDLLLPRLMNGEIAV